MLFILVGTSLLSFAGCSLVLLSFFSQSGSISVQLWVIFHWTSSTRDRTIWALILRDLCKLPVFLENSSFEIFFGQKIFQILRKQLLQKTPTSLISISIYILHPLLLSSTQSQTAGQPWHYCCKSWSWFESCIRQCPLTDSYRATSRTDCDILCGYLFIRLCRSSPL